MDVNNNDKNSLDNIIRNQMLQQPDMKDEAEAMWEKHFEKEIRRQNFLTFGFWHFNIYNMMGMLCAVTFIIFLLIKPEEISSTNNPATTVPVVAADSNLVQKNETAATKNQSQVNTYKKTSSFLTKNSHASDIVASTRKDSLTEQNELVSEPVPSSPTPQQVMPTAPVVKKEKKTIYVEKRDTVEAIDTIRSKKEWRQKNKLK